MVIGYGVLVLRIPQPHSLKEKRKVVKSIISRIRNNFNASVAETGDNDMHQRAEIGFSMVGNDHRLLNSKMDRITNLVESMGVCEIIDSEMEIMHL